MSIPMSRYVRIISSVSGAAAVAQQSLVGRRFTTDPRVPIGKIVSVSPGGAQVYFGIGSPEAEFANQYFSYVSPAPASQAKELQFAAYANIARAATVFGGSIKHLTLANFQAISTGVLSFVFNGAELESEAVDLSAATSFSNVAELVTLALPSAVTGQLIVEYDAMAAAFFMRALTTGPGTLTVKRTDLGEALALTDYQAIESPGSDQQTLSEAFIAAEEVSDSFGSASFGATNLDLGEAVELAEYVAAANVKYQQYWVVNRQNAEAWSAAMIGTASQGLILSTIAGQYKEALPMAILAATEFQRVNAAINYMFRVPGVTWTPDVTSEQDANLYDSLRVNYYGETANAGQRFSFFQRGVLCGGPTAPLDMSVHANEQDLKAYNAAQLMALFLTSRRIPANLDGRGTVLGVVMGGVTRALNNGTIIPGKTLTEVQKAAIIQGTNDPLAWLDVQTNGFWLSADIGQETDTTGNQTYFVYYTLFYAKGDSVRRVDGSHNLI
ncbi:DUF3383 domain-containing protein [Stenotrophomonas phage B2]|nr:DUF3383 domain-containing protein [Stenotrophomonas phage B2]